MRESFTYGSVGRALRKQRLYPETDRENVAVFRKGLCRFESKVAGRLAQVEPRGKQVVSSDILLMKKVLFLCSQNRLRSPTAESIFSDINGYDVLSAGLNNDATTPLTPELIEWAEFIFVMEKAHRNKLQKKFRRYLN